MGDKAMCIAVIGLKTPNDLNTLKNNERHKSSNLKPPVS